MSKEKKTKNRDGEKILAATIIFVIFAGNNHIKEILIISICIAAISFIIFIIIKILEKIEKNNSYTKYNKNIHPNSSYSYLNTEDTKKSNYQKEKEYEEQRPNPNLNIKKEIQKSNYQKGKEYEEQIGKYYQSIGYHVIYHGIEKGKKDKGIDLIATNENETLLIQCKNWEKSLIKQKHLKEFLWNCDEFIKNNTFQTLHVKKLFITSNQKIDYGVKKFMQEQYKNMNYKVIKYLN